MNDSNFPGLGYNGPFFSASFTFEAVPQLDLSGSYRYSIRDYDQSTRTDSNHVIVLGMQRRFSKTAAFELELSRTANTSNVPGAEYTVNTIAAGISLDFL